MNIFGHGTNIFGKLEPTSTAAYAQLPQMGGWTLRISAQKSIHSK
jgi:hypothetical protein